MAGAALAAGSAVAQEAVPVSKDGTPAPRRPTSVAAARAAADVPGVPRGGALPLKYTPRPTAAAITPADLMSRLYAFADDSMQGREAGTEANLKGAAFIARELQRLGLRPAGEGGTYYQDLPFVRRSAAAGAALTVDGTALGATDLLVAVSRGTPRPFEGTAQAVYGGTVESVTVTRAQADGRVVVLTMATPGLPRITQSSPLVGAAAVVYAGLDAFAPPIRDLVSQPALTM